MIRILIDESLPAHTASLLRELGYEAIHVREVGLKGSPDSELLSLAEAEGRVIATLDSDFNHIIAVRRQAQPSVIFLRIQRLHAEEIASTLNNLSTQYADQLLAGCFLTYADGKVRIRSLPIT